MRKIANILIAVGLIVALGTAGASDNGFIPFAQIVLQCGAGMGLMFVGLALKKVM